ncbi:MarR family winged helix-turn-helix transcriptional regulator [Macrococcus brunensis]|nr:MarR family winged helix-turn-helix transcriptional regulator [Macrococcus brunensis]ULG71739.1 MarR family winged helix-turn-helix transcriptional regulator [Macrococcus brunensis]ULG74001.1 MarR family winged helix-turn-helix transcriptional regulator [Macrococcus brunensis]
MVENQKIEIAHNFFNKVNITRKVFKTFLNEYQLSIYDIELLLIIYEANSIQLKNIYKNETIKMSQINKSVKKLYDFNLITKKRVPEDERTVILCINQERKEEVKHIIHHFSSMIKKVYR